MSDDAPLYDEVRRRQDQANQQAAQEAARVARQLRQDEAHRRHLDQANQDIRRWLSQFLVAQAPAVLWENDQDQLIAHFMLGFEQIVARYATGEVRPGYNRLRVYLDTPGGLRPANTSDELFQSLETERQERLQVEELKASGFGQTPRANPVSGSASRKALLILVLIGVVLLIGAGALFGLGALLVWLFHHAPIVLTLLIFGVGIFLYALAQGGGSPD